MPLYENEGQGEGAATLKRWTGSAWVAVDATGI